MYKMKNCSRYSLNVLVLTPLFSISVMLNPFHLEVLFPYTLLSTSNLDPLSPPTQILIMTPALLSF